MLLHIHPEGVCYDNSPFDSTDATLQCKWAAIGARIRKFNVSFEALSNEKKFWAFSLRSSLKWKLLYKKVDSNCTLNRPELHSPINLNLKSSKTQSHVAFLCFRNSPRFSSLEPLALSHQLTKIAFLAQPWISINNFFQLIFHHKKSLVRYRKKGLRG